MPEDVIGRADEGAIEDAAVAMVEDFTDKDDGTMEDDADRME